MIRHAESEENRRLFSLIRCIRQLGRFSLPTSSDVIDAIEFFNFHEQVDTALSDIGLQQLQHVRQKLDESNFVQTSGIQLVAHSPLQRAKQTSAGVLGCLAPHEKVEGVQRVVELETLSEQLPHEWLPIFDRSYVERIAALEDWLEQQPESVIALVGHSQYFRRMLGVGFKFHNCEVWQVTFGGVGTDVSTETCTKVEDRENKVKTESSRNRHSRWTNLQRLYTCDISRKNGAPSRAKS